MCTRLRTVCEAAGRPLEPTSIGLTPLDESGGFTGTMVALSPFVGGARAEGVPPGRHLLRVEGSPA